MVKRVFFSIILLFSVLFLPFYITIPLAIFGLFYFPVYFESIVLLFISDLLYGAKEMRYFDFRFVMSSLTLLLFILIVFFKKKLKFYSK